MTSLAEYIERMKEKQEAIYFMAGTSRKEVRFNRKKKRKAKIHPLKRLHSVINRVLLPSGYSMSSFCSTFVSIKQE